MRIDIYKCRFQGPDGGVRQRLLRLQEQRGLPKLLLRALPVRAAGHLEHQTRWLPHHSKQGKNNPQHTWDIKLLDIHVF